MSSILYLERKDIDVQKWNACISNSENENIYGYAEYLDIMAVHWDALVINDYQAVMALPWKQKLGQTYIYTPRFTSPLAIYGDIPESIKIKDILDFIPMKFRLWDLNLVNNLSLFSPSAIKRKNHILNLLPEYELLRKNYRPSYRNLLKKAGAMGNHVTKDILIDSWSVRLRIWVSFDASTISRPLKLRNCMVEIGFRISTSVWLVVVGVVI